MLIVTLLDFSAMFQQIILSKKKPICTQLEFIFKIIYIFVCALVPLLIVRQ